MEIQKLSEKFLLEDKKDVLRLYLYSKLLQHKIKPYEKDIDILLELYLFGGYNSTEEQTLFIKRCLEKNYKTVPQSVRNILSKYTKLNVLKKPKNRVLQINEEYIPSLNCDKLLAEYIITHKN